MADAVRCHRAGRLDEAEAFYRRCLRSAPGHPDALHLLGLIALQRGDPTAAEPLVRRAIEASPRSAAYHNTLGTVEMSLKRFDEADRAYRRAVALDPNLAEAHTNLGNARLRLGRAEEALAAHDRALAIRPEYAEAHTNKGSALRALGRLDEAEACYRRAIAVKPEHAAAHGNLGLVLHERARYQEALDSYDRALALAPFNAEARANRATLLLLLGRFAEGWAEYEWRWKVEGFTTRPRTFAKPLWDGSDLGGRTILLHAEQGFGSAIQFVRYAPLVAARGGRAIVECPGPLVQLFACLTRGEAPSVAGVVARGEPLPPFDRHAPLMNLPRLFGTRLETVPADVPYLAPDPADADAWAGRLRDAGGLRVGLVWAGNPRHANDRNRSMPTDALAPLLDLGEATFFSLQVGAAARDLARLPAGRVRDLGPAIHDFAETAAILAHLDAVVSVDTAVAHLAGALGRPVWLLVPFVPEWRWMLARDDSPWYPTLRIVRQQAPGDWAGAIARVRDALRFAAEQG